MAEAEFARLRRLAAELSGEVERIARSVAELDQVRPHLEVAATERVALYAIAALLETLYTGIERALTRVAQTFGETPEGSNWHRRLLESMALDVPKLRPPVLSEPAVRELEPLLSFRHRFRNLYLFDLRTDLVRQLAERVPAAVNLALHDIVSFREQILAIADASEGRN